MVAIHHPVKSATVTGVKSAPLKIDLINCYVYSSKLLASCSEAMTERCKLPEEIFYSVASTTGDVWRY